MVSNAACSARDSRGSMSTAVATRESSQAPSEPFLRTTGRPTRVDGTLLELLLQAGYLPVLAPVAISEAGEPLNVDGDRAAALVAATLRAESLVLLTGVPGVLAAYPDELSLIPHVPTSGIPALSEQVGGRMKKKLLGAQEALAAGVARVIVAGSQGEACVRRALAGRGTVLGAPLEQEVTA